MLAMLEAWSYFKMKNHDAITDSIWHSKCVSIRMILDYVENCHKISIFFLIIENKYLFFEKSFHMKAFFTVAGFIVQVNDSHLNSHSNAKNLLLHRILECNTIFFMKEWSGFGFRLSALNEPLSCSNQSNTAAMVICTNVQNVHNL